MLPNLQFCCLDVYKRQIYIHENNEITIKFNFADQHKRLLDFISNNQNTSKKEGRVYTLPSLSKSTLAV